MNMNPTKMKQKTPENKIIGKIGVNINLTD
jgi:hypothetical protein